MKRPLLTFFTLTFAITWTCFIAAGAITRANQQGLAGLALLSSVLVLLGVFTPGVVALLLTMRYQGASAVRVLLGRILQWQVRWYWYLFAIAFMPVIKLTTALLYRVTVGQWPRFGPEPWFLMAAALMVSAWVQSGEEVGWRGYALPRLASQFGLAPASVILGAIWATWHLPLFFLPGADTYMQSFPLYLAQVIALSAAFAWLYWRTSGSLLLVMLLHAAVNNTKDIVPSGQADATNAFAFSSSLVGWLTVGLLWLAASFFLLQMGRRKALAREQRLAPATT